MIRMKASVTVPFPRVIRYVHVAYSKGMRECSNLSRRWLLIFEEHLAARFGSLNFSIHSMLTPESVDDPRHSRRGQPERRRDIFPRHPHTEKPDDHAVARPDVNIPCVERSDLVSIETPFRNQKPFIPRQVSPNQPFSPFETPLYRPRRTQKPVALFSLSRTSISSSSQSFMRPDAL